jgi:hypothetical protein
MTARDSCQGLRKTYNAVIEALASHRVVAGALIGLPVYFIVGFIIVQYAHTSYVRSVLSSGSFTLMGFLAASWIVACISIKKVLPNLLSVSIFVYTCIGHWSIISLLIMILYGWSLIPSILTSYITGGLIPIIALLIVCSDIMRCIRKQLFEKLAVPLPLPDV